jgi:hypothetical protein
VAVYQSDHPQRDSTGEDGLRAEVRCFPTSDPRFRADVEELIASWRDGPITPDAIRQRITARYPNVRVERQSDLGSLTRRPVLYLYRDGRL